MAQSAYRRSGHGSTRRKGVGIGVVVGDVRDAFVEHNLLTYAAAMASQMIVALLPLAFLALALLGAFGLGHLWEETLVPSLRVRLTPDVYRAIDSTGRKIVSTDTAATIAVAGLLSAPTVLYKLWLTDVIDLRTSIRLALASRSALTSTSAPCIAAQGWRRVGGLCPSTLPRTGLGARDAEPRQHHWTGH